MLTTLSTQSPRSPGRERNPRRVGQLAAQSHLRGGTGRPRSWWLTGDGNLLTSRKKSTKLSDYHERVHFIPGHSTVTVVEDEEDDHRSFVLIVENASGDVKRETVVATSPAERDDWVDALRSVGWRVPDGGALAEIATMRVLPSNPGTGWDARTHLLAEIPSPVAAAELPVNASARLLAVAAAESLPSLPRRLSSSQRLSSSSQPSPPPPPGAAEALLLAAAAAATANRAAAAAPRPELAAVGATTYWRGTGWDARTHELDLLRPLPAPVPIGVKPNDGSGSIAISIRREALFEREAVDEFPAVEVASDPQPSWHSAAAAASPAVTLRRGQRAASTPVSSSKRQKDAEEEEQHALQVTPSSVRKMRRELHYGTYQVSPFKARQLREEAVSAQKQREARRREREAEARFEAVAVAAQQQSNLLPASADDQEPKPEAIAPTEWSPSSTARRVHVDRHGSITVEAAASVPVPMPVPMPMPEGLTADEQRLNALFADLIPPSLAASDGGGGASSSSQSSESNHATTTTSASSLTSKAQLLVEDAVMQSARAEVIERLAQMRVRMDERLEEQTRSDPWLRSAGREQRKQQREQRLRERAEAAEARIEAMVAEEQRKRALHPRGWNSHTSVEDSPYEEPTVSPRAVHPERFHSMSPTRPA